MMDLAQPTQLRLVEFNTIACGMGSSWDNVRQIQAYLQKKYPELVPSVKQAEGFISGRNHILDWRYTDNLVSVFKQAQRRFIERT